VPTPRLRRGLALLGRRAGRRPSPSPAQRGWVLGRPLGDDPSRGSVCGGTGSVLFCVRLLENPSGFRRNDGSAARTDLRKIHTRSQPQALRLSVCFRPIVLKKSDRGDFRPSRADIRTTRTCNINELNVTYAARNAPQVMIRDFFNTIGQHLPFVRLA
jgi:hypothetical protein